MIGTSSSSSTEAWLVHPEPDIWLAPSSSSFGLDGASLAAPGDEWGAWVEEEEADSVSGTGGETQAAAAAVSPDASAPDISFTSLREDKSDGFEI